MTETDELRRMLDERGVDYRVSATGYSIDIGPYTTAYANRSDTTLDVSLRQVTPEQAIAATLGTGTCHIEYDPEETERIAYSPEDTWAYKCSACSWEFRYDRGIKPNFCPNCGAKVVGE